MQFYVLMIILVSFCFPGGLALFPAIDPLAALGIVMIGLVGMFLLKQEANRGKALAEQQKKTALFEELTASYQAVDRFFLITLVGGFLFGRLVNKELGAAILVSSFIIHAIFRFRLWGHLAWFHVTTIKEGTCDT